MKKITALLLILLAVVSLSSCSIFGEFTSSDNEQGNGQNNGQNQNSNYNHEHSYGEWTITKEPTCAEDGEKQRSCKKCDYVETEAISSNTVAHTYGHNSDNCTVCGMYFGIKGYSSANDFFNDEGNQNLPVAFKLELDTFAVEENKYLTINIPSTTKYVRVEGSTREQNNVCFKIKNRTTPLTMDFVNSQLALAAVDKALITCEAKEDLIIGLYGNVSLRGANGENGSPLTTWGAKGTAGKEAIYSKGKVFLVCGAESASLKGGNGGDGYSFNLTPNNGGNGGNGGTGITADQIIVTFERGYNVNNLDISGGVGGKGGERGMFLYKNGTDGKNGTASNVSITYSYTSK